MDLTRIIVKRGLQVYIKEKYLGHLGEGDKFPTVGPYIINKISLDKTLVLKLSGKECILALGRFEIKNETSYHLWI